MLRHLVGCEHLASGEYLCPDHMRVERFDDVKCKHCLVHPSKRRRMLAFAKNFLHSIGHRSNRGQNYEFLPDPPEDPTLPPPPYTSSSLPQQAHLANELAVTEFVAVEADSRQLQALPTPRMDSGIDPQALHILNIPELDSTVLAAPSTPLTEWYATRQQTLDGPTVPRVTISDNTGLYRPVNRPTLQVNTTDLHRPGKLIARPPVQVCQQAPRSKFLAPSSSVRSTASTDSNVSAASTDSSLISPMSAAWSFAGFEDTSGFNTNLTSPIDGCPTDNNPFALPARDGLPTIHDFISELPADLPDTNMASDFLPDHLMFSCDRAVPLKPFYPSDLALTDEYNSNLFDEGDLMVEQNNVCCSGIKSLVQTVWDTLQEHTITSTMRLQQDAGNPLSDQFRSMSAKSIAAAGIRTLKSFLAGERPTSAIDTVCFVHLIYAFCLVINEHSIAHRSRELYLQSMAYAAGFDARETSSYIHFTTLVWKPDDVGLQVIADIQRSSVARGKQPERSNSPTERFEIDALLNMAFDFLDGKLCFLQHCNDDQGSLVSRARDIDSTWSATNLASSTNIELVHETFARFWC